MANNKEAKNKNGGRDGACPGDEGQKLLDENVCLSKKEYDELKAKADDRDSYCDKYMRAHAEFENARRRMEKDKIDYARFANDSLILEFLPILDNLEMAEGHIKEAKDFKAVQAGVDMIQVQIQRFLKDIGVERIKAAGEKFDPHVHEPIEIVETADADDGKVLAELKPGYRLNGRLLRPASVKIAKKKEEA
ncbi:MAG: nucleotide exchange factor GrpE [Candidatus Omnitrophica bacterium]|nr:nucleotide exchange factor GrpE [Candidatus Omnitrophota bacterium]